MTSIYNLNLIQIQRQYQFVSEERYKLIHQIYSKERGDRIQWIRQLMSLDRDLADLIYVIRDYKREEDLKDMTKCKLLPKS